MSELPPGRVFGIVGWPVAHSASPAILGAAFRELGLNATYVAFPVPVGSLPAAVEGARVLGIEGVNVTMPHKEEAAGLVDDLEGDAARLGAVNTIARAGDRLVGHNTDAEGLRRFLVEDAGVEIGGRSTLLLGSGGAARACVLALAREKAARVTVAARTPERARRLVGLFEEIPIDVLPFEQAASLGESADMVVNATPLGAAGERVPLRPHADQVVVDLIYRSTPLLEEARAAGAEAHDGLGMLVRQAALALEIWTGQEAPIPAMAAAARSAVGRAT